MLPEFPGFTPIEPSIADAYHHLVQQHPPYSDFNFVSANSANWDGSGAVSLLYGNLVQLLPHYSREGHRMLSFLGTSHLEQTVTTLLDYGQRVLGTDVLELIPETVIQQLPRKSQWNIAEDSRNHDYVISAAKLLDRSGSDLRRFRRAITTFERLHGMSVSFHQLDVGEALTQAAIIQIFLNRVAQNSTSTTPHELDSLKRLLAHAHHFPLRSYGIRVGGLLRAFIICEVIGDGWAIGHFWKGDIQFKGIYSYLMYRTVEALAKDGVTKLNIEQDLGIDNIQHFKQSFSPVAKLKKYTIASRLTPSALAPTHEILGGRPVE